MKTLYTIIAAILLFNTAYLHAQDREEKENTTGYEIELFGSLSTGDYTPFWMVSNRYGVVPLDANNGYLRAAVDHQQHFGKGFRWNAKLDMVAAVPRYHNVFIQQLYAEIGYKSLLLSVGSKENKHSLWDNRLGTGDLVLSNNARPIPEINLSIPEFAIVPRTGGWMQVKGDFALGRSFDTKYLEQFANDKQVYVKNVLWHHKSFYVQVKDTKGDFPVSGIVGVQHWAQWGGTSSNPQIGKQPHSLKDFLRIVCGSEGGANATVSDQVNVLGNHYGSYDFKLKYAAKDWDIAGYYQHFFDDKSGMIFVNGTDGLWGIEANMPRFGWIKRVVAEYVTTRNQSGPFHYIEFDHDKYQGPGGGADNYYNNGEYQTGVSYFGQSIGTPLITAPMYNKNGKLGFDNTRISAWNIGLEGEISSQFSYMLKYTYSEGYGNHYAPFLSKKCTHSGIAELKYVNPTLKGWEFKGAFAADKSQLYGNSAGFSLTVSKRGILKRW